ncbi:TPA: proteasome assembly chaperone family protein [Candidatus Bathyarchaeota archaeon]|nr:proteasome assembly chaperone family protein [Candidatus Bathyarchaeota archaeon]
MKETYIKEFAQVEARNPILIEGLPGLGLVGKITIRYLIKQLKAQKFAYLYSPHFPYFVLVNKKGSVRLLRGTFYFWKNPNGQNDVILFTGDSQSQTIEGQYEIADRILDFASKHNVNTIATIGGYRAETQNKPRVYVAATSAETLSRAKNAGATLSGSGSPIVGTAGLILGLSRFKKIEALCLLGETRGYLPDPLTARSVLEVLKGMFGFELDLSGMDEEIAKAETMVTRLQKIEEKRVLQAEETRKEEDKKTTYIS